MEKSSDEQTWLLASNSTTRSFNVDGNEDEEEEDTLSLCDLPQGQQSDKDEKKSKELEIQEDFNFCRSFSSKSEMCTADEVFFKGQILPLRNSVSSEKRLLKYSVSRSDSIDRCNSNGLFSSRSSSINSSHQSSSSGSSAATRRRLVKSPHNRFHSHPSPSPRIQKPGVLNLNSYSSHNNASFVNKSSLWSIFQVGLVTPPPEIAFQDLKTRFPSRMSNSKNSTNSNSSGSTKNPTASGKKKKKKLVLFGSGCKCTSDAIDTVQSKSVLVKNGSENSSIKNCEVKKEMSHRRTFEWLRQLSLEAASGDD